MGGVTSIHTFLLNILVNSVRDITFLKIGTNGRSQYHFKIKCSSTLFFTIGPKLFITTFQEDRSVRSNAHTKQTKYTYIFIWMGGDTPT